LSATICVRFVFDHETSEGAGLVDEAQIAGHRPRPGLRVAEPRRAGEQKKLRHLAVVQIALDRGIGRAAERSDASLTFTNENLPMF